MLRFNRLVCVLLVGSLVGIVYAKAVKIKAFTPIGLGEVDNPDGDGMAILNANANGTQVQVALTDFVENEEYLVNLDSAAVGRTTIGVLSTNAVGNGTMHAHVGGADVCSGGGPIDLTVFVDVDTDGVLDDGPTDIEARAVGSVNCP